MEKLEEALRVLVQGATGLADLPAGNLNGFDPLDRPGHPAAASLTAGLVEMDLTPRYTSAQEALEAFRQTVAPSALELIEPEDGSGPGIARLRVVHSFPSQPQAPLRTSAPRPHPAA